MPINIVNFEKTIAQKMSSATSSSELLLLTKAVALLKNGAVNTVTSFSDLPSPGVSPQQMYFVESDSEIYVIRNGSWAPIIAREFTRILSVGKNTCGKLGNSSINDTNNLTSVLSNITDWKNISAGYWHTGALTCSGRIWTWGRNNYGQLGTGDTTNRSSPGTTTGGGNNWCLLSVSNSDSGGIKTDGTLWTWGRNAQGGLGIDTTVARSSPGTVAGGGTTWNNLSVGANHMLALKTDGTLWTWGGNFDGQLGNDGNVDRSSPGTVAGGGTTWCTISAFNVFSGAIKTDGTLWTWGNNQSGRLGDGTSIYRSSPVTVAGGGTDWRSLSRGPSIGHTVAIKSNGTLWTWGRNNFGQLGTGNTTYRSSPGTTAGGGTTWCLSAMSPDHSLALKTDGTAWSWGYNGCGQLFASGSGSFYSNRSSPVTIASASTCWQNIAASTKASFFIERIG